MNCSVTKAFTFDAAHRLLNYTGKCRFLHGHTYKVEFTIVASELDDVGMAVDFSWIKDRVAGWVKTHWDHATVVHPDDHTLAEFLRSDDQVFYIMPLHRANPTAENMALVLHSLVGRLLQEREDKERLSSWSVKIWETPTSFAEAQ